MQCKTHSAHEHRHGESCGHIAVKHDDHVCYVHDGHLHHMHGDHVDEHSLAVSHVNTAECTPTHKCSGHETEHKHSATCGHQAVPHADHVDYLVDGHLHRQCGDHCDSHGAVQLA
jgi:hypothetical protein